MKSKEPFEQTAETVMPGQIAQETHLGLGPPQYLEGLLLRHQVVMIKLDPFGKTTGTRCVHYESHCRRLDRSHDLFDPGGGLDVDRVSEQVFVKLYLAAFLKAGGCILTIQ